MSPASRLSEPPLSIPPRISVSFPIALLRFCQVLLQQHPPMKAFAVPSPQLLEPYNDVFCCCTTSGTLLSRCTKCQAHRACRCVTCQKQKHMLAHTWQGTITREACLVPEGHRCHTSSASICEQRIVFAYSWPNGIGTWSHSTITHHHQHQLHQNITQGYVKFSHALDRSLQVT